LSVGDITSLDKSSDTRFLLCDGALLPWGSDNARRFNKIMCPSTFAYKMSLGNNIWITSVIHDGADFVCWRSAGETATILVTSDFATINEYSVSAANGVADCSLYISPYYFFSEGGRVQKSTDKQNWVRKVISPYAYNIYDMVVVENTIIAVGKNGIVYTSVDYGETWTMRDAQFGTSDILSITHGNGIVMVVGAGGKISTSADGGATWAIKTSGITFPLRCVAYANEAFCVGGKPGVILRSEDDGDIWEEISLPILSAFHIRSLVYNGNYFLGKVNGSSEIIISQTGEVWHSIVPSQSLPNVSIKYHELGGCYTMCVDTSAFSLIISEPRLPAYPLKYIKMKEE